MVAHQKFYFFDAGVFRSTASIGPLDRVEESEGAALETLFFQSLQAINDYYEPGYTIYFWRTQSQVEVDFILYGPRGLHAFEVKRSDRVKNKELNGLREFKNDYPEATCHLVYMGNHKEYHDTIAAIPFEEALRELPNLLT